MGGPKEERQEYERGYRDGQDRAEYEDRMGAGVAAVDVIAGPVHHDSHGGEDYQEGFREGRESGHKNR
jgi:hypothetical protein